MFSCRFMCLSVIFFIYSWSLPVKAGMRIAHLSLEMHQFRWAASWLQQRPRGGGGGPRCRQYMIRAPSPPVRSSEALMHVWIRRTRGSCTGRRWNEMRLRHGTVATAIVFFTSFLSLSWYTAWQNGKGEFISEIHSVMLHHTSENAIVFNILQYYRTISSASFIQKFNNHFIINQ